MISLVLIEANRLFLKYLSILNLFYLTMDLQNCLVRAIRLEVCGRVEADEITTTTTKWRFSGLLG